MGMPRRTHDDAKLSPGPKRLPELRVIGKRVFVCYLTAEESDECGRAIGGALDSFRMARSVPLERMGAAKAFAEMVAARRVGS